MQPSPLLVCGDALRVYFSNAIGPRELRMKRRWGGAMAVAPSSGALSLGRPCKRCSPIALREPPVVTGGKDAVPRLPGDERRELIEVRR